MNRKELQDFEDAAIREFKEHKAMGGFDVHAAHITRLYELIAILAKHLNPKPKRKRK